MFRWLRSSKLQPELELAGIDEPGAAAGPATVGPQATEVPSAAPVVQAKRVRECRSCCPWISQLGDALEDLDCRRFDGRDCRRLGIVALYFLLQGAILVPALTLPWAEYHIVPYDAAPQQASGDLQILWPFSYSYDLRGDNGTSTAGTRRFSSSFKLDMDLRDIGDITDTIELGETQRGQAQDSSGSILAFCCIWLLGGLVLLAAALYLDGDDDSCILTPCGVLIALSLFLTGTMGAALFYDKVWRTGYIRAFMRQSAYDWYGEASTLPGRRVFIIATALMPILSFGTFQVMAHSRC